MTTKVFTRPNVEPLIAMMTVNLRTISEAIIVQDKALTNKVLKDARKTKTLAGLLIEELGNLVLAEKSAAPKKP